MANIFDGVGSKNSQKMHQIQGKGGPQRVGRCFTTAAAGSALFAFPVWQLIGRDGFFGTERFFSQRNIWNMMNIQAPAQVLSPLVASPEFHGSGPATGGRLPTSDRRKANVENCFQNRRNKMSDGGSLEMARFSGKNLGPSWPF